MWWILAYLVVTVLTFIGLCRRYEPLDVAALISLLLYAIIWPYTIARG